jgi:hypothetical protein
MKIETKRSATIDHSRPPVTSLFRRGGSQARYYFSHKKSAGAPFFLNIFRGKYGFNSKKDARTRGQQCRAGGIPRGVEAAILPCRVPGVALPNEGAGGPRSTQRPGRRPGGMARGSPAVACWARLRAEGHRNSGPAKGSPAGFPRALLGHRPAGWPATPGRPEAAGGGGGVEGRQAPQGARR